MPRVQRLPVPQQAAQENQRAANPEKRSMQETAMRVCKHVLHFLVLGLALYAVSMRYFQKIEPLSKEGFTTFTPQLERFVHPGWMTNDLGNRACDLGLAIPKISQCDARTKRFEEVLKEKNPKEFSDAIQVGYKEYGAIASEPTPMGELKMAFGIETQQKKNHKEALQYLEKEFLQDPRFFERSEEDILQVIKKSHYFLARNLEALKECPKPCPPGEWRQHWICIFPRVTLESGESEEAARRRTMYSMGSPADRKVLDHFYQLADGVYGEYEAAYFALSQEEQKVLGLFFSAPPHPSEIEKEMQMFVREFKRKGLLMEKKEIDPLDFAAWTHTELVRIHPFGDVNGRDARSWSYAIERRGGYEAIIPVDVKKYDDAVKKGPESLAAYFRERVADQRQVPFEIGS